MTTYNYYLGLQSKDARETKIPVDSAIKLIAHILYDKHAGLTLSKCTGVYRYKDNTYALEDTIKISLFNEELTNKELYILKDLFNQECIAFETLESTVNFL